MPTTSRGYRYPSASAAPNIPQDLQNLATDVNTDVAPLFSTTTWTEDARSAAAITVVATAWAAIFGPYTVTVPVGRSLEVEFDCPVIDLPAATGLQGRILVGATAESAKYWSNSNAAAFSVGGFMKGAQAGAGASVTFSVQVQKVGPGSPIISAASIGYIIVRHRIV